MRIGTLALGAALAIAPVVASPAYAAVDTFDSENGGASSLNYSGFSGFTVEGQVDLVKSGDYGIVCAGGSGSCVDLDGTTGPGELSSASTYSFNAGDIIRLSFDISGSQRSSASDSFYVGFDFVGTDATLINYGYDFGFGDIVVVPNSTTSGITTSYSIAGSVVDFSTYSIFFTAGSAGSLTYFIGTSSTDNIGPVVDNIGLSVATGAVPEPATWAMMIFGFGMVGGALRRRRAVTARAAIA